MDGCMLPCGCMNKLQVCYRSMEVCYTIADLCRGPLYESRPVVGRRFVYVNYRPALLYKFPYDDVTTIRSIHVCVYYVFRGYYNTFTLRRPVYKNSSAEFSIWMCESIESCDYQCNRCISTFHLYAN